MSYTSISKQVKKPSTSASPVSSIPISQRLAENTPIAEKMSTSQTQTIQAMLQTMQETALRNHQELKQEMNDIRGEIHDIRGEIQGMNLKMENIQQAMQKNEQKIGKIEEQVEKMEKRVDRWEIKQLQINKSLGDELSYLEMEKASYYLRFQNVIEEKDENIGKIMVEIIAGALQKPENEIIGNIDEVYRVFTNYAKRHKLPREVHIRFCKKSVREELYRTTRDEPLIYKEKEISVLKQIPRRIRDTRRKYQFLTQQLLKNKIPFRWLVPEGLLFTWHDKRIRIQDLQEAHEFFDSCFSESDDQSGEDIDSKSQDDTQSGVQQMELVGVTKGEQEDRDKTQDKYERKHRQAKNPNPRYR